jgi:hypothetical protein
MLVKKKKTFSHSKFISSSWSNCWTIPSQLNKQYINKTCS